MDATFLDTENFKIDSSAWQVQDAIGVVNGKRISIKVKVNPEGDIREYVTGVPASCIGQQIFTYAAGLRETSKIGQELPEDQESFQQAIDMNGSGTPIQQYKEYFAKTNIQLVGCYSSGLHVFDDIGVWAFYRLADGNRITLNSTTRSVARRDETMGYSVRLG